MPWERFPSPGGIQRINSSRGSFRRGRNSAHGHDRLARRGCLAHTRGEMGAEKVKQNHTGLILFAHGSSVEGANRSVKMLADEVRSNGPYEYVEAAFLEMAQPDLAAAVARAAAAGLEHIIVVPYFLTLGVHLRDDLPRLVAAQKQRHPKLEISVAESLDGHPQMASLILEMASLSERKTS